MSAMATAYLEMALDDIPRDAKMSRQTPYWPSFGVKAHKFYMVLICQFRDRASSHIDRGRYWIDVVWIHTRAFAAKMIGLQSYRPWANTFFPHGSMGDCITTSDFHLPIATPSNGSSYPNPTRSDKSTILYTKVPFVYKADAAGWSGLATIENTTMTANEPSRFTFDVPVPSVGMRRDRGWPTAATLTELCGHKDTSYQPPTS